MLQKMKRTLSITAIAATAALVTACGGGADFDGQYDNDRVGASLTIDGTTFTMIDPNGGEDVLEAKRLEVAENDDGTAIMTIYNDKDREEGVLTKHEDGHITVKGLPGKFEVAG